jgi:hypothetical protein
VLRVARIGERDALGACRAEERHRDFLIRLDLRGELPGSRRPDLPGARKPAVAPSNDSGRR